MPKRQWPKVFGQAPPIKRVGSNSHSNFLRNLLEVPINKFTMENKNTVIDAKISNLNVLTKVLSVKELF